MQSRRIRRACVFFWFVGWDCISLGLHVSLACPNIEIHVPFGFFKVGWGFHYPDLVCVNAEEAEKHMYGWEQS